MIAFETSARIRRPIDEVFAYLSDPLKLPQWNSAVLTVRKTAVRGNGDTSTFSMERELPTGRAVNELKVAASERPHELAIRTTAGRTPFIYHYRLTDEHGETVVTLEAQVELPGAASLLPPLARRLIKSGVDDNFATLKHILEARRRRTSAEG